MRKFKKIAATVRATAIPGESLAQAPTRRRLLAGLSAAVLASLARPAGRARADQPTGGGILAENFTWLTAPNPAPVTPITRADGQETTLAAFQGRVVLLNFWATWCAPCIREMPSLDRLQAKLKGEGLVVVAVSEDFAGLDLVEPFFERMKLENLAIFLDSDGALSKAFGIAGLPTTLLIDREGRVVGGLEGPAEWDSGEAVTLIRHYLQHPEEA
jgi:thiol-disulfide isomerase/thioredoxin